MEKKLPEKSVERLSLYRRALIESLEKNKYNIFSHELAALVHTTPEQVRRDLMLIGYSSSSKKGYDIEELIKLLEEILDTEECTNVAIIGMGNLGTAISTYLKLKRKNLNIIAAFDVDTNKINRVISGVKCYHIDELKNKIKELDISVGVLTMPIEYAREICEQLILSGIKGILNYTTYPLNVPQNVYLEEYDMITSLEKVIYYVKNLK